MHLICTCPTKLSSTSTSPACALGWRVADTESTGLHGEAADESALVTPNETSQSSAPRRWPGEPTEQPRILGVLLKGRKLHGCLEYCRGPTVRRRF